METEVEQTKEPTNKETKSTLIEVDRPNITLNEKTKPNLTQDIEPNKSNDGFAWDVVNDSGFGGDLDLSSGLQEADKTIHGGNDSLESEEEEIMIVEDNVFDFLESEMADDSSVLDETIELVDAEVEDETITIDDEEDEALTKRIRKEKLNIKSKKNKKHNKSKTEKNYISVETKRESITSKRKLEGDEESTLINICRKRQCYVKMFNFNIDYEEDIEDEPSEEEESNSSEPEEIDLEDSPAKKTPRGKQRSPKRLSPSRRKKERKSNKPKRQPVEELSEYEKIRAGNIAEREALLASLGIHSELKELKQGMGLAAGQEGRRQHKEQVVGERRRSSRIKMDEDKEWTPNGKDEDDDDGDLDHGDHSHHGLRRHPCKECTNCLQKDCRRCVFCKDKSKYGGPNIKKQRCEQKERCSRPQVVCVVCKGVSKFNCEECETLFQGNWELKEHMNVKHGKVVEEEVEEGRMTRSSKMLAVEEERTTRSSQRLMGIGS